MRHSFRFALVLISSAAQAAPPALECFAGSGRRVFLDAFELSAPVTERPPIEAFLSTVRNGWSATIKAVPNQQQPSPLIESLELVDCWSLRRRADPPPPRMTHGDVNPSYAGRLLAKEGLAIVWGESDPTEPTVHFALLSRIANDDQKQRVIRLGPLDPALDAKSRDDIIGKEVSGTNVLPIVAVLTLVETRLHRIGVLKGPNFETIEDRAVCWTDEIQSVLTWAKRASQDLLKRHAANAWVTTWIATLEGSNRKVATENRHANCWFAG
jgi:hypothetical protein